MPENEFALAQRIASQFSRCIDVESVAIIGSTMSDIRDQYSDLDLVIYHYAGVPKSERLRVAKATGGKDIELDNHFIEPGDLWTDIDTGIQVDIVYRAMHWVEQQLDDVLDGFQARLGISTNLWFTISHSQSLYDRNGWYSRLQQRAQQPYPDALVSAIFAKNYPVLRTTRNAYRAQLAIAVTRKDHVTVNDIVARLLSSYFDIIFAINRLPHPGPRQLVRYVTSHCQYFPQDMSEQVEKVIRSATTSKSILTNVDLLLDSLDELLLQQGRIQQVQTV